MGQFRGDYLGFTYNGFHSSDLGIVRVSDGSRYSENLLPSFQDKTVTVPGKDETYYFGSFFSQQKISIQIAFDNLSEEKMGLLARILGDKKVHPLSFDERPYKEYQAKIADSTLIKHICFNEKGRRVYKGEGSISFVSYQPYAICRKKFLNQYTESNKDEWKDMANLQENQDELDKLIDNKIKVYNPGVKESDCILSFGATEGNSFCGGKISLKDKILTFSGCSAKKKNLQGREVFDTRITFNSKTKMIEGWYKNLSDNSYQKSGNIYNEYIDSGDFFDIPITIYYNMDGSISKKIEEISIDQLNNEIESLADYFQSIEYNYYYY